MVLVQFCFSVLRETTCLPSLSHNFHFSLLSWYSERQRDSDCEKKILFEGEGWGKVAERGSWEVMKINPIETKFN